jgi:hypothetical protein
VQLLHIQSATNPRLEALFSIEVQKTFMHKQVIDNALILAYNEPARVEVINLPVSIELAKRETRVVKMSCILSDQVCTRDSCLLVPTT